MTEVNTTSRTQKIIVDPASYAVSIIYTGPPGPAGVEGPPGPPGKSTGQFRYKWLMNNAATDPGHGFAKSNSDDETLMTEFYVSVFDQSGEAVIPLSALDTNSKFSLYEAGKVDTWNEYRVTATPTLMDTREWYKMLVVYTKSGPLSFTPGANQDIIFYMQGDAALPVESIAYRHVQAVAAVQWNITHNLDFRPNVAVVDSSGREIIPEVTYTSNIALRIDFSAAVGGEAYLS